MSRSVKIIQEPGKEIPLEIIADHIKKVAEYGALIKASRLKQKTITILLSHLTGLSQRDIVKVLDAIPALAKEYLR